MTSSTDAFWRLFAETGGVGAYLLYKVSAETPPDCEELLRAEMALAQWELAEEWSLKRVYLQKHPAAWETPMDSEANRDGAVSERRHRSTQSEPGRSG